MQPVEHSARVTDFSECQHRACIAIPRAEKRFVDALTVTLGGDECARAPRAVHFKRFEGNSNRQRRILPDNRRSFARHPNAGLSGGIIRIAPVLPFPSQAVCLSRIRAVRSTVQRFHTATIVGSEPIDF